VTEFAYFGPMLDLALNFEYRTLTGKLPQVARMVGYGQLYHVVQVRSCLPPLCNYEQTYSTIWALLWFGWCWLRIANWKFDPCITFSFNSKYYSKEATAPLVHLLFLHSQDIVSQSIFFIFLNLTIFIEMYAKSDKQCCFLNWPQNEISENKRT
jgi:hypothetical protein